MTIALKIYIVTALMIFTIRSHKRRLGKDISYYDWEIKDMQQENETFSQGGVYFLDN